jgi:hypothetical protein
MGKKKIASNSSLGHMLINNKKPNPKIIGEGPQGRGFKVVSL